MSKNQIKFIRSLEQKKFRKETGLFVAEGKKIVNEIIHSSLKIHSIFSLADFHASLPESAEIEKKLVDENGLKKISFLSAPNEVLCIVHIPSYEIVITEIKSKLSLLLDNIKDPGNLGNIIRIADWFGIENIFCTPGCVDAFNPKVVQATMGSVARVRVFYREPESLIAELRDSCASLKEKNLDYKVYASSLNGKNIYNEKLGRRGLIILGNESEGISGKLMQQADLKITIPSNGKAESLNVAASSAVILSEFRRAEQLK